MINAVVSTSDNSLASCDINRKFDRPVAVFDSDHCFLFSKERLFVEREQNDSLVSFGMVKNIQVVLRTLKINYNTLGSYSSIEFLHTFETKYLLAAKCKIIL